jgi:WD repeat and SOF domain-containing protein 1
VTASETLDLWDTARSEPVHSFSWGADSIITARYNPADPNIVAR